MLAHRIKIAVAAAASVADEELDTSFASVDKKNSSSVAAKLMPAAVAWLSVCAERNRPIDARLIPSR